MQSVTKIEETNNIKNNKSKIESKNVQIKSSEIDNKEKTRNRNAKTKSNTSTQNKSSKTNEVIVSNEETQIKKDTNSASSVKTITGLSSREVQDRIDKGLINYNEEPKTKTVKDIVKSNVFTYFSLGVISNNSVEYIS